MLSTWMCATLFFENLDNFVMYAVYECRSNVYTFEWNGRKLRLLPTTPTSTHVNTPLIEEARDKINQCM